MRWTALAVLCLACAVFSAAQDQSEPPPEGNSAQDLTPDAYLERLGGLNLDDKQKAAVKAAAQASFEKTKPQREELRRLEEQMRAARRKLDEESRALDERVREQLTLEQKDRFDMMRLKRRMRRHEERPGRGREFRPEGMPGEQPWAPGQGRPTESFPPEMWHEHAPPGAPPAPEKDPRRAPPDLPPGAPTEPGTRRAPPGELNDMGE